MPRRRSILLACLGAVTLGVIPAQAALTEIKGEVLDVETATARATTGSYAPRAMERAKTGGPMAILADDGVYLVEGDFTANRNAKLLDFVAKKIIAKGTVSERDGKRYLRVVAMTVQPTYGRK